MLDLAEGLREEGGTPVLVPLAEGLFTEEARDLGYDVRPLAKRRRYDVARIPTLVKRIREGEVDILHSHAVNGAFYACPAGRLAGLDSQVCSFHGSTKEHLKDIYRYALPRVLAYRYYLGVARWCRRLIAASEQLKRDLISDGVPPDKLVCIPNGIDPAVYDGAARRRQAVREELGLPPSTTVIGTMGRLAAVKDMTTFLELARRLLRERRDLIFLVAGDGPERAALEQKATEAQISSAVRFLGWRSDAAAFLSTVDVFVMSSLSETGPLVSLGAMALGIPVASTAVGIMQELPAYQKTGLVVPCGDPEALANAVRSVLDDPQKAQAVGRLGREIVERFYTKEAMVRRTLELYDDVVAGVDSRPIP